MVKVHCSACGEPLDVNNEIAMAPDGKVHVRCAKVGQAQGTLIDTFWLIEQIASLKRRVQELEETVSESPS